MKISFGSETVTPRLSVNVEYASPFQIILSVLLSVAMDLR